MTDRHRPSERLAPRPCDRIADRLHLAAAWATTTGTTVQVAGVALTGDDLSVVATAQERDEAELLARFEAFRDFYTQYTVTLADRERVLFATIAEMRRRATEPSTRASLRLAQLRRPPLAKVRAAVSEARRASNG
jgi:hypothetical protein